jgi:hypothetical protein
MVVSRVHDGIVPRMNPNMIHQIFIEREVGYPVSNLMMYMEKFLKRNRYRVCSNQLTLKIPPTLVGPPRSKLYRNIMCISHTSNE